eukprot:CAMPEP_0177193258 /NCGR_PEP_ID=MMETSP0367-20130122/22343_1 /TAXON_ID=447022 ORGANISM="Scrippsiella hangoei-like, Strain SHHI-4" /NCGR_SAMPLE_ID=MMETSP0367 /ASSEMBLY_ACC=CAM_ASM_000362 /LENGTH=31 /DNA_ID= /DNA_START= /DNA_END= /DNA_ORIENTATION=
MTFEGWMPMGTVWPLALSLVTLSMWMRHFLR